MDIEALQRQRAEQRTRDITAAAAQLGSLSGNAPDGELMAQLAKTWDSAFEAGRLAALDEFQDRFCVCMKS